MSLLTVAKCAELAEGVIRPVTVAGKQIAVLRHGDEVFAFAQKCPHLGGDLCAGTVSGTVVTCPKHAASFDVSTGAAVGPAKLLFLKLKPKGLTIYPVTVSEGVVLAEV
jgi:nitrite reductase/ring-hydroxylating ferredoxin subunit